MTFCAKQGIYKGFFTGYLSTLAREVPFSAIQFPLYEFFKSRWALQQGHDLSPLQASMCGALGGGISGFLTTPLDVIKTRLMLGRDKHGVMYTGFQDTASRVYREGGMKALFSGYAPRTIMITAGGLLFFGGYEFTKAMCLQRGGIEDS